MKLSIFLGADGTGKSGYMLVIAKIFAMLNRNKKVLVIDGTKNQGVHSFFNYNKNVEHDRTLNNLKTIVREECYILCNEVNEEADLNDIDEYIKNYDYVFIELDSCREKGLLDSASRIFFFQDLDKHTLNKNKLLLRHSSIDIGKVIFVFDNLFDDIKYDTLYLLNELIPEINIKGASPLNDIIEIYFDEQDYMNFLTCKIDGYIDIGGFTNDLKVSLYEMVSLIEEISPKRYKKIIK